MTEGEGIGFSTYETKSDFLTWGLFSMCEKNLLAWAGETYGNKSRAEDAAFDFNQVRLADR